MGNSRTQRGLQERVFWCVTLSGYLLGRVSTQGSSLKLATLGYGTKPRWGKVPRRDSSLLSFVYLVVPAEFISPFICWGFLPSVVV